MIFVVFLWFFVLVQIQKVIFCKKRWPFCVYWISHFERHSTQWSQLIKDTTLFLFFLCKSLGGNTISRQKRLELSVVLYLLIELFYIGMPVVRTDGRVYGHVITKISRLGRLPNFLIPGAPLRIKKWTYRFEVIWSCFVFCCLNLHIW